MEMNSSPTVGFCVGAVYDTWFSTRLGYEVRLLYVVNNRRKILGNVPTSVAGRQRDELSRSKDKSWSGFIAPLARTTILSLWGKSYEGEDHGLLFSDLAPFLIISATSYENAQRRLSEGERLDITKFRANVVVEGAEEPFEEEYWAELLLESCNAKLILTQNCARRNSLNVDYDTGKLGQSGAGKLIKKLNSDRRVDRGIMKWNPVFGRYAFLFRPPSGKSFVDFSVGSEITLLRENTERTTLGKCVREVSHL